MLILSAYVMHTLAKKYVSCRVPSPHPLRVPTLRHLYLPLHGYHCVAQCAVYVVVCPTDGIFIFVCILVLSKMLKTHTSNGVDPGFMMHDIHLSARMDP